MSTEPVQDPVNRVREIILNAVASCGSVEDILNLRTVCTNWLASSFDLLCDKVVHRVEFMGNADEESTRDLERFMREFPLPATLPLDLKFIGGLVGDTLNTFIQLKGSKVVRMTILLDSDTDFTTFRMFRFTDMKELRRIHVKVKDSLDEWDECHFETAVTVLNRLASVSPKLEQFFLEMNLSKEYYPGIFVLPQQLTHLSLTSTRSSHIHQFLLANDLPNLIGIEVVSETCQQNLILPEVIRKFGPKLKQFKVVIKGVGVDKTLPIHVEQLPALEELSLVNANADWRVPLQLPPDTTRWLPNLAKLSITLKESLDLFRLCSQGRLLRHVTQMAVSHQNDLYDPSVNVLGYLLDEFSNITEFSWNWSTSDMAARSLKLVYSKLPFLNTLSIYLQGLHFSEDLTYILTGVRSQEIPQDEHAWPQFFNGNRYAITNLQCLRKVEVKCFYFRLTGADPFLFRAAFFPIPTLDTLVFRGLISVDEEMVTAWKEAGREILITAFHE